MSENSERMPFPATEPNASEKWGDPPLWNPWNFQYPKLNREEQETSLRRRLRQLASADYSAPVKSGGAVREQTKLVLIGSSMEEEEKSRSSA